MVVVTGAHWSLYGKEPNLAHKFNASKGETYSRLLAAVKSRRAAAVCVFALLGRHLATFFQSGAQISRHPRQNSQSAGLDHLELHCPPPIQFLFFV
jgi:hypothetical protein